MARLEYEITGNISGLATAADGVKGILNNLQLQADKLNLKLFGAETEADINAIGGALTIVTGKINEYTTAAIQGSQAFKDQSAQAALDALSTKISVLTGNAQLFGESIKNQQAQITAYQQALNKILAQGFDPLDKRITSIKSNIDRLTGSIEAQKNAAKNYIDPFAKFQTTGSLIKDAENKVRNLTIALKEATSTRDIALYNTRLTEANKNLDALKTTGLQASQGAGPFGKIVTQELETGASAASKLGKTLGSAFGALRTAAYILPGIGIAGIFNLGFEAISKVVEEMGLFNSKITQAQQILNAYNEVQKEANKSAGTQIASLQLLYKAATDTTRSMEDRIQAAKELKDADFDAFGAATNLAIVNGQLKNNLDAATDSILKQAQAQAALAKIQAISGSILDDEEKKAKIRTAEQAQLNRVKGPVTQSVLGGGGVSGVSGASITLSEADQRERIHREATNAVKVVNEGEEAKKRTIEFLTSFAEGVTTASQALKKANDILGTNLEGFNKRLSIAIKEGDLIQLQALENALKVKLESLAPTDAQVKTLRDKIQQVEDIIKNAYNVKPTKNSTVSGLSQEQFLEQIGNISRSSGASANQSGLVGLDLELQQIKDKYIKYYADLENLDAKRDASKKISDSQRLKDEASSAQLDATLRLREAKEISDAIIKDEQRTVLEVQRIRDEFGVKATQTRAREIAAVNTLADSEVIKAQGNAAKLKAIDEGRTAATQAINEKYELIISQTYEKINDIVAQANANQVDTEATKIAKIGVQYDKLTQQVNKYYADLKTLQAQGDASLQGRDLNGEQQTATGQLNKSRALQISIVLSATFSKALQGSIDAFGTDLYSSIINLGRTRQEIDSKYLSDLQNATDDATREQVNKIHELELATTTSFSAIFADLVTKFNQNFSQSLVQSFVKKITDGFGETLISSNLGKVDPAVSISNAGLSFSQVVIAAGQAFAASAVGSSVPLATSLTSAGHETEHSITTGGANAQTGLSKGAANLAAAASIIGGVVSGLGKPTNTATSALGGALSGAGEGALIGSVVPGVGTVVGAVAGGIIGAIGGIFSSSKARKIEQQQLEEAKKQTALQKAQLDAYTSQIIGRMTANGVISGISVGATGQLIANVSGKDLQFILDRNAKIR